MHIELPGSWKKNLVVRSVSGSATGSILLSSDRHPKSAFRRFLVAGCVSGLKYPTLEPTRDNLFVIIPTVLRTGVTFGNN